MRTAGLVAPDRERWPAVARAEDLARELLGAEGTRLAHVRSAGFVASRLALLFEPAEAEWLVVAASLHDIGYSPRIAHSGFHPLDGAAFLRGEGFPERVVTLVANHSLALMIADGAAREALAEQFPSEGGLLTDALAYADMHSAPDGRIIPVERRLADIAHRHADPREAARAAQLRAAMARVGAALIAVQQDRRPATSGRAVALAGRAWLDLRDRTHDVRPDHGLRDSLPRDSLPRDGLHDDHLPSDGLHADHLPSDGLHDDHLPSDDLHADHLPSDGGTREDLHLAFDAWWSAEVRYARELDCFHFEASVTVGVRDVALRLAHLRSVADLRRDRYFRRALT